MKKNEEIPLYVKREESPENDRKFKIIKFGIGHVGRNHIHLYQLNSKEDLKHGEKIENYKPKK